MVIAHLTIIRKQYDSLRRSTRLGYVLILTSAILYAFMHVVAKPLLGSTLDEDDIFESQGINPVVLAVCIYVLNGIFFTPLARKTVPSVLSIDRKKWLLLISIGIAEVSALIAYFFGLRDSSAINASIFSNGEIIFSLLIAMIIFKERLRKNELSPFVMIIIGMIGLPIVYDLHDHGVGLSSFLIGDVLIILSGLLYAIDVNISKYVSDKIDAKRITQITSFASGLFALLILIILDIPFDVDLRDVPMISVLAFVGTGVATLFFVMSLRLLGGVRTILLYSTTVIFGILFSSMILYEEITIVDIFSTILVLSGIYFLRNKLDTE